MKDQQQNPTNDSSENRPLTEEELFLEEVLKAQEEALEEERIQKANGTLKKKKQPIQVRMAIMIMAVIMIFSSIATLFQVFSIPAVEFIKVSAKLSQQEDIQLYKQSVVTISTGDSKGTGFAISEDGYIVTNAHVIEGALSLTVNFPDHGIYEGQVIDTFPEVDLAILKVEAKNLPALALADQLQYELHEPIYFIGNPLYFSGIANEGTLLEAIQPERLATVAIMMDAPVYKGNSGSPVLDMDGQVMGVVYATTRTEAHGKVGLFVPIDELHKRFTLP